MSTQSTDDLSAPATGPWKGFTCDEALKWSRLVLRFLPHPAGAGVLGAASSSIASGRAPSGAGWVDRVRTAIALGFTPAAFSAWLVSLRWVPAGRYAAHPDNHTVEHPMNQPGHTFDAEVWAGWPFLLAHGLTPEAATHYALLRAEERGFDPSASEAYDTARAYDARYDEVLARRREHYGIDGHTAPQRWIDADSRTRDRLRRTIHEASQTIRERSIRGHAEADAAHGRREIRDGFDLARRRWADARRRADELQDAVEFGAARDEDRRRLT